MKTVMISLLEKKLLNSIACSICYENKMYKSCKFLNCKSEIVSTCSHPICTSCHSRLQQYNIHSCPTCHDAFIYPYNQLLTPLASHMCTCNTITVLYNKTLTFMCAGCCIPTCFMCGLTTCTGCNTSTWSRYTHCNGTLVRKSVEKIAISPHKDTVHCLCGQELSKAGACNELRHCPAVCICNYCGAFTYPWEEKFPAEHWNTCLKNDNLPCDALGCIQNYKECIHHKTEIKEFLKIRYENVQKLVAT